MANSRTRTVIERATCLMLDRPAEHPRGWQELDLETLTRLDVCPVRGDDCECICAEHRRKDVRRLLLRGYRVPAVLAPILPGTEPRPFSTRPTPSHRVGRTNRMNVTTAETG